MNNNTDKSYNWKNWIIKKLLSNDSTKEDILNFIANESNDKRLTDYDENNEKNLIKNILQLNEKSVEDLMVPRSEIIAVDHSQTYSDILELIKEESHSRMPVYKTNIDNVVGFFHIKDFIKTPKINFNIDSILREALFVAPKSPILDLLKRMRSSRIHIGLVVDGVGGVDGLVTIEDLVEEIVGDIEDEHDAEDVDELIFNKTKSSITVDASWLDKVNLIEGQQVDVLNINNGNRLTTYIIEGKAGEGEICLNGAAARLNNVRDRLIIVAYAAMTRDEYLNFKPKIIKIFFIIIKIFYLIFLINLQINLFFFIKEINNFI